MIARDKHSTLWMNLKSVSQGTYSTAPASIFMYILYDHLNKLVQFYGYRHNSKAREEECVHAEACPLFLYQKVATKMAWLTRRLHHEFRSKYIIHGCSAHAQLQCMQWNVAMVVILKTISTSLLTFKFLKMYAHFFCTNFDNVMNLKTTLIIFFFHHFSFIRYLIYFLLRNVFDSKDIYGMLIIILATEFKSCYVHNCTSSCGSFWKFV